jgi:predicted DNA-binding protein YlxM (UPF0122 family)
MNCLSYEDHIVNRFWSKVIIPEDYENECWEWQAHQDKDGYGRFHIRRGTIIGAHRFSYQYYFGDIPYKILICHSCDNPSCVSPYHLFPGTNKDNLQDMANKGRSTIGETNINAILTDQAVVDILEGIMSNRYKTITEIMDIYNVSRPTIHRMFKNETWTHITCNYPNLQELFMKISVHKLTDDIIIDILEGVMSNRYQTITEIVNIYNISPSTVYDIFKNKSWTHITCNYPNFQNLYNKMKTNAKSNKNNSKTKTNFIL